MLCVPGVCCPIGIGLWSSLRGPVEITAYSPMSYADTTAAGFHEADTEFAAKNAEDVRAVTYQLDFSIVS